MDIGPGGRRPRLLRTLVGDALRRERLAQHRTLADVARDARVSLPYLSEVERGRKEASSEVLAAVCAALRMDLSDLLTGLGRELARDSAPVIRLDTARRDMARRRHEIAPPAPRSGDAVLLAA